MKTLFTQEGKDAIIQRINKLTPHSQKQWGKMNVSQMLAHAQKPLEVAIGTHALDNSIMLKVLSALFGKVMFPIHLRMFEFSASDKTQNGRSLFHRQSLK